MRHSPQILHSLHLPSRLSRLATCFLYAAGIFCRPSLIEGANSMKRRDVVEDLYGDPASFCGVSDLNKWLRHNHMTGEREETAASSRSACFALVSLIIIRTPSSPSFRTVLLILLIGFCRLDLRPIPVYWADAIFQAPFPCGRRSWP